MQIDTARFSYILEEDRLRDLPYFLSRTAFVVSHKSESIQTLLQGLWYLPIESPIIVVTNCLEQDRQGIETSIKELLPAHRHVYVIHQKDAGVAQFFDFHDVEHNLGDDQKVRRG